MPIETTEDCLTAFLVTPPSNNPDVSKPHDRFSLQCKRLANSTVLLYRQFLTKPPSVHYALQPPIFLRH
jgi:hypothetical protein